MSKLNEDEETLFWNKTNIKYTFAILGIPFLLLAFFSHTNIRIQISNFDFTGIVIEFIGPFLVFYFLYKHSASGNWKTKIRQVLEALYLFKDQKNLKDALVNFVIISLLSFSLILPVFLSQSNLFGSLGYVENLNIYDIVINYFISFATNVILITTWEEILFRGYFLNFVFRKMKKYKKFSSIVISSIIFMGFHIFTLTPFNPDIRLLSVFLFGLFLGYNLIINKNLLSNIAIHAILNVEITQISEIIQSTSSSIITTGTKNFNDILNRIRDCGLQNYKIDLDSCIKSAIGG